MIETGPQNNRGRLARILGLPASASSEALRQEGQRLLRSLRRRASQDGESGSARSFLGTEIASLESTLKRVAPEPSVVARESNRRAARDRTGLMGALMGSALMIAFLIVTSADDRMLREPAGNSSAVPAYMARLVVTEPVGTATLRVLTADRDQILHSVPASGASLDLVPGRYAIEIDTPGCEEPWTRSLFLDPGSTRHVQPTLCGATGALRIQAEIAGSELFIDGVSVGEPGDDAHELSAGEHEIRVESEGYHAFASKVRVEAGRETLIAAEFVPQNPHEDRRKEDLAFAFEPPVLTPEKLPKPTPFDLGDLTESLSPNRERPNASRSSRGLGRLPDGGSTDWHARVSGEFLARYDHDRSGAIDQIKENDAVSCSDWRQTEQSFERGGLGLSMARYYGFDGSEWHLAALGFARTMRGAAYFRMRECGLHD